MAPAIQAKILRVLQEKEVYRLGGREPRPAQVRVLAATNQDLHRKIDQGGFRLDLYHRVADCSLRLPPLRERCVDLPNLAVHFLVQKASETGVQARGISKAALGDATALSLAGKYPSVGTGDGPGGPLSRRWGALANPPFAGGDPLW